MIKDEVKEFLRIGNIEKSTSPWNSPVIPKKDGSRRFVVDYRNVNSVIKSEIWPLPRIEDILDRLAGSKYFSVLDLTSGYWQVEVDESFLFGIFVLYQNIQNLNKKNKNRI